MFMEGFDRFIVLSGEKLNSMTRKELDDFLRHLGSLGVYYKLFESKIRLLPEGFSIPEELANPEELGGELGVATYRDLQAYAISKDRNDQFINRLWNNLGLISRGIGRHGSQSHFGGVKHEIIKIADKPLYELGSRESLIEQMHPSKAKSKIEEDLRRIVRRSMEYIDLDELASAIDDRTLEDYPGVGKGMRGILADFVEERKKIG